MDDLEQKVTLVYDYGQNIGLARRLSREFGKVLYYCPWKDTLPVTRRLAIGTGFPDIERVRHFGDVVDQVDLFVFPDIYDGDLQLDLERRGKRVWGSRKGDRLEYDRPFFLDRLEDVGLPVPGFKVFKGVDALQSYLEETKDKWVKLNLRGDDETWHHIQWENLSERKLESYRHRWGPLADDITFTVVDNIDSIVEAAYDGFCVTSEDRVAQFPEMGFLGYEDKNMAHILTAIPYDEFPDSVREVNDLFAPELARYNVRSAFGTEIKIAKEGKEQVNYFLDATCRQPDPPGPIVMEMVKNLGAFMWHGSVGELIPLDIEKEFGVQVNLYSSVAQSNISAIEVPGDYSDNVKLNNCCMRDGVIHVLPDEAVSESYKGTLNIGSAVATSDSIEDAIDQVKGVCEALDGLGLSAETDALAECLHRIKEGEKQGIEFTDGDVPEPEDVLDK